MKRARLQTLSLSLCALLAACSEPDLQAPEPVRLTNAEFVLNQIQDNPDVSGVVFHTKPLRSRSCEYMFIEFSATDNNGQLYASRSAFPGQDPRENFGQDAIADQLHFVTVDTPDRTSAPLMVTGLGCKPYNKDMWVMRGKLATLEVSPGTLTYAGEIGYTDDKYGFSSIIISDRSDFAKPLVSERLPAFTPIWQVDIMEKFEVKLSPEQEAALKKLEAKQADARARMDVIKAVSDPYDQVVNDLRTWRAVYVDIDEPGVPEEAKAEHKMLVASLAELMEQVSEVDRLLRENKSPAFIEKRLALIKDFSAARQAYRAHVKIHGFKIDFDTPMSPELQKLSDDYNAAKKALRAHR